MIDLVLLFGSIIALIVLALAWPHLEAWHRHRAYARQLRAERERDAQIGNRELDSWDRWNGKHL